MTNKYNNLNENFINLEIKFNELNLNNNFYLNELEILRNKLINYNILENELNNLNNKKEKNLELFKKQNEKYIILSKEFNEYKSNQNIIINDYINEINHLKDKIIQIENNNTK